jgi:hypothetical protein
LIEHLEPRLKYAGLALRDYAADHVEPSVALCVRYGARSSYMET